MIIDYALLSSMIIEAGMKWSSWTGQEINVFFAARSRSDSGYYGTSYRVDVYMNAKYVATFGSLNAVEQFVRSMFPRKVNDGKEKQPYRYRADRGLAEASA